MKFNPNPFEKHIQTPENFANNLWAENPGLHEPGVDVECIPADDGTFDIIALRGEEGAVLHNTADEVEARAILDALVNKISDEDVPGSESDTHAQPGGVQAA